MTAQETLMSVVRDDVSEIKEAIVGNGNPGLAHRVTNLESTWSKVNGWTTGVKWVVGILLTLLGLSITVYEVLGG